MTSRHRNIKPVLQGVFLVSCVCAPAVFGATTEAPAVPTLSTIEQQAKARVTTKARVPLAEPTASVFSGMDSVEPAGSGRVPNYLRAIALMPKMPAAFSHWFKVFISDGALPSQTKLAMALRIAQINNSPYTVAHIERLLRTTERGKVILTALQTNRTGTLTAPEQRALAYAEELTKHVDGLSDSEFQAARAVYNDAQVVELSFTVCFFNYFTRFSEALSLPVEAWVFETSPATLKSLPPGPARVSLVSDEEMKAVNFTTAAVAGGAKNGLGIPIANSQRAMLHTPAMYGAFREFGMAAGEYAMVSRQIKLQVSLAVSTANGCRYCTLHQVLGLRNLGVDPAKLMALQKDDSALTTDELAAVVFARKLTASPGGTSDDDYNRLRAVFGEQGAMEVLMQTCNFAFMNRFTDGLRLPSEDEAVKVYHETYGSDWHRKK